jgi:DNA-binding transcriptional LysR family regulator
VLIDYLLAETIELFISPPEHVPLPSEVSSELIGFVHGAFIARRDHPLFKKTSLKIADIFTYPFASARNSILRKKFSLNSSSFVCDNDSVLFELVETSDVICVSTLQSAAKWLESGRLTKLQPLDFHFEPSEVLVTQIRGRTMSPIAREVVQICRTCLAASS